MPLLFLLGLTPAQATYYFPLGDKYGHINDESSFVDIDPSANILFENRTVFTLDQSLEGKVGGVDQFGVPLIGPTLTDTGYAPPGRLSGMLYDVVVTGFLVNPNGTTDYYLAPGLRYAGGWTDTVAGPTGFLAAGPTYGGLLVVYEELPVDTSFAGGPGVWTVKTHATADPSMIPGGGLLDDFPTISDVAEPYLIAVLAPLPGPYGGAPAGSVMLIEDFGKGVAFANVIGGYGASQIQGDRFGLGLDIRLEFNTIPHAGGTPNGWQATSSDPITFGIVPEPISVIFFATGLIGVGGYVVRRRELRER